MRRPSRRTLWVVSVLALLAVVVWAVLPSRERVFREKVADLRSRGFATTVVEFLGEAPPGAEDAARDLVSAFEDLGAMGSLPADDELAKVQGYPWVRKLTGPWDSDAMDPWPGTATPEQLAALRAWFGEARPFYERVSEIVSRPALRFPVKLDADGYVEAGHVPTLQKIQRILSARSLAAADPVGRIAACRDQLRLGRSLVPGSTIECMVAHAIQGGAIHAIRAGVESGELPATDVRNALAADLVSRPADADRERIARHEIAFISEVIDRTLRGEFPSWWPRPTVLQTLRSRLDSLLRGDRDDEEWTPATVAAALETWAQLAEGRMTWSDAASRVEQSPGKVLLIVPQLERRFRQREAALALAHVALAVKACHEASGEWPADLDGVREVLGGTVPPDPFTGAPFAYEIGPESVRIASAGVPPGASPLGAEDQRECGLVWAFRRW